MRGSRQILAVLATVALLAAGCGDDDDGDDAAAPAEDGTTTTAAAAEEETTTTSEAPAEEGQALEVTAVDYEFTDAPTEIQAGLVDLTFTNDGLAGHELALVEIGDTPLDTFLAEFPPVLEGGPFPEYVAAVAVAADVEPGESAETTFLITEGEYALVCALDGVAPAAGATTTTSPDGEGETGPLHFTLGMAQTVSVAGGDAAAALPESEGSITASDYAFEVDVQAGEQTVTFTNEGPDQIHHAVFFPFAEGVDETAAAAALDTFFSSEEAPPPPELDFAAGEGLNDAGIFSTGLGQTITETFESGRTYAVVCFLQDRTGGPPHAIGNNMREIFTVE